MSRQGFSYSNESVQDNADLISLLLSNEDKETAVIFEKENFVYTPGDILTSTLWNQSGTICIKVDGVQKDLKGYTYNKFCPDISATDDKKSVTGCSNTAESQILYYWLEKGYTFDLTVTVEDYYTLKSDNTKYFATVNPANGELSMQELNELLKKSEQLKNLDNGDFIAGLNFYCGLKNHSKYGDSTSTSWSYGVHFNGNNANVFKSAGFDSAYFISLDKNTGIRQYILTDGNLNETGYAILRENIDYGEVIRVGIPGHAIYMDGYRKNSSDAYEYHLNYGWGKNSTSTKWYTVAELEKLELTYITIDISPDIKVDVKNSSSEYCSGSFLRGLERINHIWNDKATSFTFSDALAGQTITISAKAAITSSVDVTFQNITLNIHATSTVAFESANAMSFDLTNGSISVNNEKSLAAIKLNGNEILDVDMSSSWIYSGYLETGFEEISKILDINKGYSFDGISADFISSVSGYAFQTGSAADSIDIANNSAVLGDISLGEGQNSIFIENGSLLYGGFEGIANTLSVTMNINDVVNTGPMIVIDTEESELSFLTLTNRTINVVVDSVVDAQTFALIYGVANDNISGLNINLTYKDTIYQLNSSNYFATDKAKIVYADNKILLAINDNTPPQIPVITPSTTQLTNSDVILTATFPSDAVEREYCINNGAWQKYPAQGVIMTQNGSVVFRATDANGNSSQATYAVTNIDKTAPEKPVVSANINLLTNQDVILTAVFDSANDQNEYSFDGVNWQIYSAQIVLTQNADVSFRSTDAAGNSSEVVVFKVDYIDKTPPDAPVATADITAPTTGYVTVSANFSEKSVKNEYSLDGVNWLLYFSGIIFTENGSVSFRSTDNLGNISTTVYEVKNIDRIAPEKPQASADITGITNKPVTVTAAFENPADKNEYSLNGVDWYTYTAGIVFEENGSVSFRSTDAAGNISGITNYEVKNIDKTAPDKPAVTASTTNWTNKDITVSVTFDASSIINEFKIDDGVWMPYQQNLAITQNCRISLRSIDAAGNETTAEYDVKNIDKTAPDIHVATSSQTFVKKEILVEAYCTDSGSGISSIQYSFDAKSWFNGSSITVTENCFIYFKATDNVGNEKISNAIIENIIADAPASDIAGTYLSQIVGYDAQQGKVGYIAVDGATSPQWKGVWEWNENDAAMWEVAGTGNFYGSKSDKDGILLYNKSNNTFAAWTDIAQADYGYISLCHVESAFKAVATASMDMNDFDDIIIADANGSFGIVFDGTKYHDIWHADNEESAEWELLGTGNFGNDIDNLIVKNNKTHHITIWGNNDITYSTWDWSVKKAGYIGSTLEFAAAGDFSADGIDDIIVRNKFNNEVWLWEDGNSSEQRWIGTMDEGFEIESVGDYNGDGVDDLLLREYKTGWGGLGYWASGYAGNWVDLNTRIETGVVNNFAVIS